MLTKGDIRRRKFGLFCISGSGLMVIWGFTALESRLAGIGFALYWLLCLTLAFLAMLAALWDYRVVATRQRQHRREVRESRRQYPADPEPPDVDRA